MLVFVFVGACGKERSRNESKKVIYVHLLPDSLLDASQIALKRRLEEAIMKYVYIQDNYFVLKAQESDFINMHIPLEYYELLKKNIKENNNFITENGIEHVEEQFNLALGIMKYNFYSYRTHSCLDSDVSMIINERFGESRDFEVTEINYIIESKDDYLVFVEYKTENGTKGNYVKTTADIHFDSYYVKFEFTRETMPTYLRCIPENGCPYSGRLIWRDSVVTPLCKKCELKVGTL